ncbi:MAG: epoxide hydrolase family protein [Solirubrobacteraceae bacterium]
MSTAITPFRIDVPEAALADLRARLRAARWPEREPVEDWSQGVPLAYLQALCAEWAEAYDWRATEARLNAIPQCTTEIDGLLIHFLHVRSPDPDALPLVLTHGWPGSVLEFEPLLALLPEFHLVVPSLPGYGFSGKPEATGWGVERIARAWAALMARLGYDRYGAAGSDWGTSISTLLGVHDRAHVAGIHLVPPLAPPDPATAGDRTDAERRALADLERVEAWESGYSREHATRPQTIGYALVDSPVALAAWIVEKYFAWTDNDGRPEDAVPRRAILDTLTLYWLTRTGASSARLYWESIRQVDEWIAGEAGAPVDVPTGCTVFPREIQRPSRRWAARRFTDIRHWGEPPRGGHFAGLEQPAALAAELRAFFRLVR